MTLYKQNIHDKAAIAKPVVTPCNKKETSEVQGKQDLAYHRMENIIWSDEWTFTVFPTIGLVYVCRTPAETCIVNLNMGPLHFSLKSQGIGAISVWEMVYNPTDYHSRFVCILSQNDWGCYQCQSGHTPYYAGVHTILSNPCSFMPQACSLELSADGRKMVEMYHF